MDANDRQNEIMNLLTAQDRVEVEDLARRFGVSLQTVRTDLRDLPLVTIDGADARDFDDAVYARKTPRGWRLCVATPNAAA